MKASAIAALDEAKQSQQARCTSLQYQVAENQSEIASLKEQLSSLQSAAHLLGNDKANLVE